MARDSFFVEEYREAVIFRVLSDRLLDAETINEVSQGLISCVQRNDRISLVIDMKQVTHMSSAMIGKLVAVHKMIKKNKGRISLCEVTDSIMPLFVVTKLTKVFDIGGNTEDKVKLYNRKPL